MTPSSPGAPAPVAIIGAGLTGLACGLELAAAGREHRIYEASATVGGLARSEVIEGYTFDATGHWMHLRDPEIRRLVEEVLGENKTWVERSAAIWLGDRFVPYPFQTNVWALPLADRRDCLRGLLRARDRRAAGEAPPRTFRDFVYESLGEGIAERFMIPYNRKLWGVELEELSLDWIGRFVPQPSDEELMLGCLGPPEEDRGYNARFLYPREGGIQALPDGLAARLPASPLLSTAVVAVDPAKKKLYLAEGSEVPYEALVSTMALPRLVSICEGVPDAVREAAGRLRATHVTYASLGVRQRLPRPTPPHHWVYFPEERFPFYRAGCASAAVPSLAPEQCASFYIEFSHHADTPPADAAAIAEAGLREVGLVHPDDPVEVASVRTLENAYVIHDEDHARARAAVLDWLSPLSIHSVGRYGRWEYASMEDALLAGRHAARVILDETSSR
ncbi:MAG: FAD-dependent oxidoreductase [Deltaproteobacteria bacterium]|nr:FAD-dependent oxidoreductase [Deltaproteobacteria bacterium]